MKYLLFVAAFVVAMLLNVDLCFSQGPTTRNSNQVGARTMPAQERINIRPEPSQRYEPYKSPQMQNNEDRQYKENRYKRDDKTFFGPFSFPHQ